MNTVKLVPGDELEFVTRATNTVLSAADQKKKYFLLLKWLSGCDLIAEELTTLEINKGGVPNVQQYFSDHH